MELWPRRRGPQKRGDEEGWAIRPSVSEGRGYTHTLYLPGHWDVTGT